MDLGLAVFIGLIAIGAVLMFAWRNAGASGQSRRDYGSDTGWIAGAGAAGFASSDDGHNGPGHGPGGDAGSNGGFDGGGHGGGDGGGGGGGGGDGGG